jgi:dolichyl-phosphate-mannose--protein O-mannosyl transferase
MTRNKILAFAILILGFAAQFANLNGTNTISWDEYYYLPNIQRYMHRVEFKAGHPPVASLVATAFAKISGAKLEEPWTKAALDADLIMQWSAHDVPLELRPYRLSCAFFGGFVPMLVFLVCLSLRAGTWNSFFIGILACFHTGYLSHNRTMNGDSIMVFCAMIVLYLFVKGLRTPFPRWALLATMAALCGILYCTKSSGLVFIGFPILYAILKFPNRAAALACLLGVASLTYLIPWYIHMGLGQYPGKYSELSPQSKEMIAKGETWHPKHLFRVTKENLEVINNAHKVYPWRKMLLNETTHPLSKFYIPPTYQYTIIPTSPKPFATLWHVIIFNPFTNLILTGVFIWGFSFIASRPKATFYPMLSLALVGCVCAYFTALTLLPRHTYPHLWILPDMVLLVLLGIFCALYKKETKLVTAPLSLLAVTAAGFWSLFYPFIYGQPITNNHIQLLSWFKEWGPNIF